MSHRRSKPLPPKIETNSTENNTLSEVLFPVAGPNFNILPGVGGMFVKGFGLIRGPPSCPGIPIYYFHPLQPPPFEAGLYSGMVTIIEGESQGRGEGRRRYDEEDEYDDDFSVSPTRKSSNNRGSEDDWTPNVRPKRVAPTDDKKSIPYVPKKRSTQEKQVEKPKAAAGWAGVLEEMAKKRGGGGLKKIEDTVRKDVGKLKGSGKKKEGFVDMIDELKDRLARLSGNKQDDEETVPTVAVPIVTKTIQVKAEIPALDIPLIKAATAKSKNVPFPPRLPTSWPPIAVTTNEIVEEPFKAVEPIITATDIEIPKPVESTQTTEKVENSTVTATQTVLSNELIPPTTPKSTENIESTIATKVSIDPRIVTDSRTPSHTPGETPVNTPATAVNTPVHTPMKPLDSMSSPFTTSNIPINSNTFSIPIQSNSQSSMTGITAFSRQGVMPIPSGYYIPAPRLDMVAPGSFEYGGLTTQHQIDAISRLIRLAIHNSENRPLQPVLESIPTVTNNLITHDTSIHQNKY